MIYITSKKDDLQQPAWQSLNNYFELGWEVTTTHFDAKYLYANGKMDPEKDKIVTLAGREFLYSKLVPTMSWEQFARENKITDARNAAIPGAVDLTTLVAATASPDWNVYNYGPEKRYRYEDMIRNYVVSLDVPSIAHLAGAPYALCCWRYRDTHIATRNTPADTAKAINDFLVGKVGQVYVVGLDTESLCDGQKVKHVDLPTFAALCLNPNCKVVAGAMTGTMQLAAILCKCGLAVYQHNAKEPVNTNNCPCVMGECVNIWRNKRFVMYQPETPMDQYLTRLDGFIV